MASNWALVSTGPWIPAVLVAMGAGVLDWRYRRIPNWLTVSGLAAGVAVNTILYRWPGLKAALLGTLLGLGLLLPFVLVRSLGAGDWKLAGALGACLGPRQLLSVLIGTILVAGVASRLHVWLLFPNLWVSMPVLAPVSLEAFVDVESSIDGLGPNVQGCLFPRADLTPEIHPARLLQAE